MKKNSFLLIMLFSSSLFAMRYRKSVEVIQKKRIRNPYSLSVQAVMAGQKSDGDSDIMCGCDVCQVGNAIANNPRPFILGTLCASSAVTCRIFTTDEDLSPKILMDLGLLSCCFGLVDHFWNKKKIE